MTETPDRYGPMTEQTAEAVYDLLVREARAPERQRRYFVHAQTEHYVHEWRFMGVLGFGGKFRRGPVRMPSGRLAEGFYVDCYSEDQTPTTSAVIETTNAALAALHADTYRSAA